MPRKGITGHDEWVITEALATALDVLTEGLSLSQTLSCLAVDRESDDDRAQ